jgi:hypothetical protein
MSAEPFHKLPDVSRGYEGPSVRIVIDLVHKGLLLSDSDVPRGADPTVEVSVRVEPLTGDLRLSTASSE